MGSLIQPPTESVARSRPGWKAAANTSGREVMITITGAVGSSGKYLVTGMPVNATTPAVLKMSFENNTSGTNLSLVAGTTAEFTSGTGGTLLSDSGGPGFVFLTIIEAHKLNDRVIFVRRSVGTAVSEFTLVVD
jgi:hypothetical protein